MPLSEDQIPVRYRAGVRRCEALAQECEAFLSDIEAQQNGEPLADEIEGAVRAMRDRLNDAVLVLEARAGDEHRVSKAVEERCAGIYSRFKVLLGEVLDKPLFRPFRKGKQDSRVKLQSGDNPYRANSNYLIRR